ncbi:MAG: hypothetical protein ACK5PB_14035 [Pirellula sp.]
MTIHKVRTETSNVYQGQPFSSVRDSMLTDEACPYPRIVAPSGDVLFVDRDGLLTGKKLIREAPDASVVASLADTLQVVPRIQRPWISSYRLKHDLTRSRLFDYISNGSMIAAAFAAGLTVNPVWGSVNCNLNVSRKWHRAFLERIDGRQPVHPCAGDFVVDANDLRGRYPFILDGKRKIYFDSEGLFTEQRFIGPPPDFLIAHKVRKVLEAMPRSEQISAPISHVHRLVNATIDAATIGDCISATIALDIPYMIVDGQLLIAIATK